jgi:hypothetical protein
MTDQTTNHRVTKLAQGPTAVAELKDLIRSFEHLGFVIQQICLHGIWNLRGELLELQGHMVSTPKKDRVEIAPAVFVTATEDSVIEVTADRDPTEEKPW